MLQKRKSLCMEASCISSLLGAVMYRRVPVNRLQKDTNLSPEGVVVRNAGTCDVLLQSVFGIFFVLLFCFVPNRSGFSDLK
jgi:hypothetical protein